MFDDNVKYMNAMIMSRKYVSLLWKTFQYTIVDKKKKKKKKERIRFDSESSRMFLNVSKQESES